MSNYGMEDRVVCVTGRVGHRQGQGPRGTASASAECILGVGVHPVKRIEPQGAPNGRLANTPRTLERLPLRRVAA
jgi:hypothetical protein